RIIHPAGFFHSKAKNIMKTSERLCEAYGGEVPADMNELTTLSGVGRKTANIVLEHAFGITVGIAVDTHVGRLSKKLGFTENTDPVKAEKDLMALFPEEWWGEINYLLIRHGREVCQAKKPDCAHCIVRDHCRDFMNRENYNHK
ncbi:MAG: endonuclease III, partial [Methanosarcinaceae archaeon]|nr:endonuclease III [Methanosarcinaceae archaeon]